jgi:hypothetical protein
MSVSGLADVSTVVHIKNKGMITMKRGLRVASRMRQTDARAAKIHEARASPFKLLPLIKLLPLMFFLSRLSFTYLASLCQVREYEVFQTIYSEALTGNGSSLSATRC